MGKAMAVVTAVCAAGLLASPAVAAGTRACSTPDLRIRQAPSQGAAGTFLLSLSYRNVSHTTCHRPAIRRSRCTGAMVAA